MSTLVQRRANQVPRDWQHIRKDASWRDLALTMFFAAIGVAVTAAVLVSGIPLTGPDIFAG